MKKSRPTFGPWSTALHDDLGEHLNTFWRQRLASLPRVAKAVPRLSRRVMLALGLIALAVALVPTMRFAAAVAEEDKATTSTEGTASDAPFTYRFANGVEVELIGLSMNPSKEQPWWRPDGSPLEERPYHDVRARMRGGLPRELCFRWKNLPPGQETSHDWHTTPPYGGAGGVAFSDQGLRVKGLEGSAFTLHGDPKTCTIKFHCSVDATPWKTAFKRSANASMHATGTKTGSAVFGPLFRDKESTAAVVSYQIPGKAVRLIGIDKEGATRLPDPARQTGGSAGGVTQMTFCFQDSAPEDFVRFELQTQTRTIERVEFRNVSLHPGEETKVEITRVSEEQGTGKEN